MTDLAPPVIFLPGAGGGSPDLEIFRTGNMSRFEKIGYPSWQSLTSKVFSPDGLISDLAEQITVRVPRGPIHIIGHSIGGHFGYAAALRLQSIGRQIAGFCAIDTFMIDSSEPSAGWKGRAFSQALELLQKGRFGEFIEFTRSRFWRFLIRLASGRLPKLLGRFSSASQTSVLDPILQQELSMRLLLREVAPWVAGLDRDPVPLMAPAILLRTRLTAGDDEAWRRRCPNLGIYEVPGHHHSIFEPENAASFRQTFVTATRDWS